MAEVADLSFTTNPTGITAAQIGGLLWTVGDGAGAVLNNGTSGTGTYTALGLASSVTLDLTVVSGPSAGMCTYAGFSVVPPSGARMTRYNGQQEHTLNEPGVGMAMNYWLDPKDVSFSKVTFAEDQCPPTDPTGYFTGIGWHDLNSGPIDGGNITTGCKVTREDHTGWFSYGGSWGAGSVTYDIPTLYIHNGDKHSIGICIISTVVLWANGDAQVTKYGISVFSTQAAGTTQFGCGH